MEKHRTVVIGGGQAGLAAAQLLSREDHDVVVLESHDRIGESWRNRWDSLRLFTPAKFNGLPGLPFPGDDFYFPTKDEVVDYLKAYTDRFKIPVRFGTAVDSLSRTNGSFTVAAGEKTFEADNVIVAAGPYHHPLIPGFASGLRPSIFQIHSSEYRNPGQVPEGPILVVGAGNSGSEIAIELANSGRKVWLAGRDVGRIPADTFGRLFGGRPYWAFISRVMSIDTPVGRRIRPKALRQGTPLIRLSPSDAARAGVQRCGRVQETKEGLPRLEDGTVLDVSGVLWATGFRPDYRWIQLPVFDEHGLPKHVRGIVPDVPGLYFVGLHFQTALSSALLGGVGSDAQYVTRHLRSRK